MLVLRVTLEEVSPAVWREIAVPEDFDFWALHCAIQDAMGWEDAHLHQFRVPWPGRRSEIRIGIPDEAADDADPPTLPGWHLPIAPHLPQRGSALRYLYDFGDDWSHLVKLRERRPAAARERLPRCLDGARACPPEDCGGPYAYPEFLEAIRDPRHEEHAGLLEWVGGEFDPEAFDAAKVRFRDPEKEWRRVFGAPARPGRWAAKAAGMRKGRGRGSS